MSTHHRGIVFLSHATEQRVFVGQLQHKLEDAGWTVHVDFQHLRPGDALPETIRQLIDSADHVVGMLSPEAAESKWVRRELRYAAKTKNAADGQRIVPLQMAGATDSQVRAAFEQADPGDDEDLEHCPPERLWIEVGEGDAALDELLPELLAALEPVGGSSGDADYQPRVVSELGDLVLRLKKPRFKLVKNKHGAEVRRPAATASFAFYPPGAQRPQFETRGFAFVAPLGELVAGELSYYLERYFLAPFGTFTGRAAEVERQLPAWGRELWDALNSNRPTHEPLFAAWRSLAVTAQRRFTVRLDPPKPPAANADAEKQRAHADALEAGTQLLGLPWELLRDDTGYLFHDGRGVRVRRALPGPDVKAHIPPDMRAGKLRVLIVCPRPEADGVAYIDHRVSVRPLVEALNALGDLAEYKLLSPPTFAALRDELQAALERGQPYHVVHFDGHGVYDKRHGLGGLVFEKPWSENATRSASEETPNATRSASEEMGNATRSANEETPNASRSPSEAPHKPPPSFRYRREHEIVDADRLGAELRNAGVGLFFLEACQSARSDENPGASVAGRLLQSGIESVAAMSHSVLVDTARRFTEAFYPQIVRGQRVGAAMLAGQRALYDDKHRGWGLRPVESSARSALVKKTPLLPKEGLGEVSSLPRLPPLTPPWERGAPDFAPRTNADGEDAQVRGANRDHRTVERTPLDLDDWFVPVLYQSGDDPPLLTDRPLSAAAQAQRAENLRRALEPLPPEPPHTFVGRSRELLAAERLLLERGDRYVVFRGEGGEGKTTLAAELARWLVTTRRMQRTAFVSVEHVTDARQVLAAWGEQLVPGFSAAAESLDAAERQIVRRLQERPTVLVLDNHETLLPPPQVGRIANPSHDPSPAAAGEEDTGRLQEDADPLAIRPTADIAAARVFDAALLDEILTRCRRLLDLAADTRLIITSREPLPADSPFAGRRHLLDVGRLGVVEGMELVARVLAGPDAEASVAESVQTARDQEIETLVRTVQGHARSLVLLTGELRRRGLQATTADLTELMADLETRYPGQRESSLFASVELSLRRLPTEIREKLAPLGVFQGGACLLGINMALQADAQEVFEMAMMMAGVGLAELTPVIENARRPSDFYLRFDPALAPVLLRELHEKSGGWGRAQRAPSGGETGGSLRSTPATQIGLSSESDSFSADTGLCLDAEATARSRWAEACRQLAGFLDGQQSQDAHLAAHLTLLELPNLLAALRCFEEEMNVAFRSAKEASAEQHDEPTDEATVVGRCPDPTEPVVGQSADPTEPVVGRSPDRTTVPTAGLPSDMTAEGRPTVGQVCGSGDPPTTGALLSRSERRPSLDATPDTVIGFATSLEGLLQHLNRRAALAEASAIRARADELRSRLGDTWTSAAFRAAAQAIDRLLDSGRHREAVAAARTLVKKAAAAGPTAYPGADYDIAMSHFSLGRALKRLGDPRSALLEMATAREQFDALSTTLEREEHRRAAARMAAKCLTEEGDCLAGLGALDEAAAKYEDSIGRATAQNDRRQIAVGRSQLGTVRLMQRRYAEALTEYHASRAVKESLGESTAVQWHQIGRVHEQSGQLDEAEAAYLKSLAQEVESGNKPGEATSRDQLGLLYTRMPGRGEQAVEFHRQAADICQQIGLRLEEGRSHNNAALALQQLGRFDAARDELTLALECDQEFGLNAEPWKTWGILSELEIAVGAAAAAAAARDEALRLYESARRQGWQITEGVFAVHFAEKVTPLLLAEQGTASLPPEVRRQLPALAAALRQQLTALRDEPRYSDRPDLQAVSRAVLALLDGSRDPALWQDPALYYADAVELKLLLEQLAP